MQTIYPPPHRPNRTYTDRNGMMCVEKTRSEIIDIPISFDFEPEVDAAGDSVASVDSYESTGPTIDSTELSGNVWTATVSGGGSGLIKVRVALTTSGEILERVVRVRVVDRSDSGYYQQLHT